MKYLLISHIFPVNPLGLGSSLKTQRSLQANGLHVDSGNSVFKVFIVHFVEAGCLRFDGLLRQFLLGRSLVDFDHLLLDLVVFRRQLRGAL